MYKTLTLPLLVTLLMHGIMLAFILWDAPGDKPLVRKAPPRYIEAKLVTLDKPKAKPAPKSAAKPKAQSKSPDTGQRARAEAAARRKAQQAEQRRLQQQKIASEKAAREKAAQAKAQQEKLAREAEQQRQAEQKQRLEQQQREEFQQLIEQENAERQASSDSELANSYIAQITRVIQNNWSRPPSARKNMEAELALQLVPTGEVISVHVVSSSGNAAFDRSAEKAVLKVGRFPTLQKLPPRVFEKYFRRLHLVFRPEDLRL